MEPLIIYPKSKKQLTVVKAVLKALEVSFKKEEEENSISPEFEAKIERSLKQVAEGNYITLDPTKSLWENLRSE